MVGPEPGADAPRRRQSQWLLVVLLGLVAVAALARAGYLPRPFRPTIRLTLADHDTRTMAPRQYMHWEFEVPARVCFVTGQVTGAHDPADRFYVALMGDADFRRFEVNHAGNVFWDTTGTATRLSTTLEGPGSYHLIVSNHFSATESKTVTTSADVECP